MDRGFYHVDCGPCFAPIVSKLIRGSIVRNTCWSLLLIFFGLFNGTQDIVVERATEEEVRQVQEVSDTFERRMRETRDINSLKDLFLNDFMRLQIEEEKAFRPGQSLILIPSVPISIEADMTTQVTQQEWQRFYAAQLNFRYYFVLLLASRMKPDDLKNLGPDFKRKLFPREVFTLLESDPFLKGQYALEGDNKKYKIETVEEFRSLLATLEQATLIVRQRFLKQPPEQTKLYRENLRRASTEVKPRSTRSISAHVSGTAKGTRRFTTLTADSLFELWLVKTDRGMKIAWAQVYPFN